MRIPLSVTSGRNTEVLQAELALVWRQMPVIVLASVLAIPIVALAALDSKPMGALAVFVAAHWVVAGWRLYEWSQYQRQHQTAQAPNRRGRLMVGVGLSGLLWMLVGAWLVPGLSVYQLYFAAAVVAGMCAGAATSLANHPPALLLYLTPTVGGLAFGLVQSDVTFTNWFAMLLFVYIGGLSLVGISTHRSLIETIALRQARDQLANDLTRTGDRLQQMIDMLPVGVHLFGPDERLVLSNAAVSDMIPFEGAKFEPGAQLGSIIRQASQREADHPDAQEQWARLRLQEFRSPSGTRDFVSPSGRWVRAYNARLANGDLLATYVDITSLKDREAALRAVAETAQSANEAKSNFLALMSHELRTPLNSILGFAELLQVTVQGEAGGDRVAEYADDIQSSGRLLLQIINDILDLSKIEAGHRQLDEERIDLARVIVSTFRLLEGAAQRQELTLVQDLPSPCPVLWSDQKAVSQILINLVGNAVKFSRAGGSITVQVKVSDDGLYLCVQDTGIGIAPEDLERVVEPFAQSETSYARKQSGTGLGLAIVKSLAELQGARFELESTVGVGTLATVIFPPSRIQIPAPRPISNVDAGKRASGSD